MAKKLISGVKFIQVLGFARDFTIGYHFMKNLKKIENIAGIFFYLSKFSNKEGVKKWFTKH